MSPQTTYTEHAISEDITHTIFDTDTSQTVRKPQFSNSSPSSGSSMEDRQDNFRAQINSFKRHLNHIELEESIRNDLIKNCEMVSDLLSHHDTCKSLNDFHRSLDMCLKDISQNMGDDEEFRDTLRQSADSYSDRLCSKCRSSRQVGVANLEDSNGGIIQAISDLWEDQNQSESPCLLSCGTCVYCTLAMATLATVLGATLSQCSA
ncbi:uncharacterized protein I206_105985 [Kwoniella pini CBS 10737]|uniref:Uncharacterized protein n=1 Tax=Kwoniella pini CBS 10737 TaxID=1296096 RepID=A0A1B9I0Z6_9TREE|nr:uncharacterized protein I206_04808 [Kwoniella pini CBS 10737]OCF49121.1 hypothetical protein I206_04808 [Kwoniella pini CBS 10737]